METLEEKYTDLVTRHANLLKSWRNIQSSKLAWVMNGFLVLIVFTMIGLAIKGGQTFVLGMGVGMFLTSGFFMGLIGGSGGNN